VKLNVKSVSHSILSGLDTAVEAIAGMIETAGDQFQVAVVGAAWCVVRNRFFITAYHVLNNGQARDPTDNFIILRVPGNGLQLQRVPVVVFTLEIDEQVGASLGFNALDTYTAPVPDGT
jgi:hypothetical protein